MQLISAPQGHSSLVHATLPAGVATARLDSTLLGMFALNTLKFHYSLSQKSDEISSSVACILNSCKILLLSV